MVHQSTKKGRFFDGDKLEQLTLLLEFSFDGYIKVDKITGDFVNESSVIEDDMVIALCYNVTVESSENNIKDSFPVEHKTRLSEDEKVKRYTNDFFFIDRSTRGDTIRHRSHRGHVVVVGTSGDHTWVQKQHVLCGKWTTT